MQPSEGEVDTVQFGITGGIGVAPGGAGDGALGASQGSSGSSAGMGEALV